MGYFALCPLSSVAKILDFHSRAASSILAEGTFGVGGVSIILDNCSRDRTGVESGMAGSTPARPI
jgi:hypothetical protein